MIKSYTVMTTEVDDGEVAFREITGQLAPLAMRKNSVGIVFAHPEFITSGVYAQVAGAFPFPIVGTTTISHCAGGAVGTYMLSVTILTSDDCSFACSLSERIPMQGEGDIKNVTRAAYNEALGSLDGKPKLALLYAPFSNTPYLSECLPEMSAASGGTVPIFGAVANDDNNGVMTEINAQVLYGTETYNDKLALTLVSGAVAPKFYIASATEESIVMPRIGVITKADNCKLLEINNVGAAEFLRSAGFPINDPKSNSGLLSSIFILNIDDGNGGEVKVSRIPHGLSEVWDGILCGGDLTEGAVLSIAFNTREVVLESTRRAISEITGGHNGGTAIIHTCLGRRYGLLSEPLAETELINRSLGESFNCVASYANGELCPTSVTGGKADNRFHNQTLVACVFD